METASILEKLNNSFADSRSKNPAFSLRAYSKQLGVSVSTLSEIRSGKRKITYELAERLVNRLHLSPMQREHYLRNYKENRKQIREVIGKQSRSRPSRTELRQDEFELISEWYYLAILSLLKLKEFDDSPDWIARRLGIPVRQAKSAMNRLNRLQLIGKNAEGKIVRKKKRLISSDGVDSSAVKYAHVQALDQSRRALDESPVEDRDFVFHVFASNKSKLSEYKSRVREFLEEITEFMESETEKSEIYRISMNLIPLSNRKGEM